MVSKDGQTGLQDEPIADREIQAAIKDWDAKYLLTGNGRRIMKAAAAAKEKVRDLLPAIGDGLKHRYTFIDETAPEPVQYVVNTRPGPDDKDVPSSKKTFQPRLSIDMVEAPRE